MQVQEQLLEILWAIDTLLVREHLPMITAVRDYMQLIHLDILDQEILLDNMLVLEITQEDMLDHETIRHPQLSTLVQHLPYFLAQDQQRTLDNMQGNMLGSILVSLLLNSQLNILARQLHSRQRRLKHTRYIEK